MEYTQATRSAQRHRSSLHWNVKRRIKVASPCYGLTRESKSGIKLTSKPPCYAVLKYMASLLLSLVTLKYQGKSDHSLFEENPAPAWCLLIATCAYGLTIAEKKQMPPAYSKWSRIISRFALAAGVLSAVSLASIFLPRRVSFVPLVIWTALWAAVFAWPVLHQYACNWLQTAKSTSAFQKIRAKVVWTRGGKLTGEASLPV